MRDLPMRSTTITRRRFTSVAAALGLASVSRGALAQSGTPAPVASPAASPMASTGPVVRNLITAEIEQLPEAPFTVRLLRISLEPGTINPLHTHHGPEVAMVESGELLVKSKGKAFVTRADGKKEDLADAETTLMPGDTIHYPAEVAMYYENTTDTLATMLNAVVIPVGPDFQNERITYLEGKPDLTGLSYKKLGDGLVQKLDKQAAKWTVDQIDLPAGTEMPAFSGVAMVTPLQGNLSFKIDAGKVQVTRADSTMLQPNAVLGTSFSLGDGDAAFFPNGVGAADRSSESNPLSLLSMNIAPVNGVAESAAAITFSKGDGTVAHGNTEPVDATGMVLTINTDGVNMRSEASTNGDIIDQLALDTEVEVVSGPVEADDYVWYEVKVTAEGGSQGWVADEFLDGLTSTTSKPSSSDDGTSGDGANFAVGDKVVTTEADVRLRPEASTGAEAIDALPLETELTVTGESIDADGYTWIPVETADGSTGFVVADFIKIKD